MDKNYNPIDDRHLRKAEEDQSFYLEIRFHQKCRYPRHPPFAMLNTNMKTFPRGVCLKITSYLMNEAISMSESQAPSVFSLVGLLENSSELHKVISGPDSTYSFKEEFAPKVVKNDEESSAATKLMEGLRIKDNFSNFDKRTLSKNPKFSINKMKETNESIFRRYHSKGENPMLKGRMSLPAWNEKDGIIEALRKSQVVVVSGMTGCGKSTQIPQFILDEWLEKGNHDSLCNIIVTQPRRLSAIGVAERVASERNEKIGNVVGYQIRLESKTSNLTRLLFCTTGILLRRLEGDSNVSDVTHIIVDEVHERSEESDFLLMILRDLLPKRPDLRIILMSATLNSNLFAGYFGQKSPIIEIPGRTFPVQQIFLGEVIDRIRYTLEDGSPYARPPPKFNPYDLVDQDNLGRCYKRL